MLSNTTKDLWPHLLILFKAWSKLKSSKKSEDKERFRKYNNLNRKLKLEREKLTQSQKDEAIENGEIAGCGLDVFETEPLPEDHKLWKLNNVLMTPHVAVADADNLPDRRFQVLLENARRFLKDEKLENVVDKSKWY